MLAYSELKSHPENLNGRTLHELRMQLSRGVAMEAFDSAVRKKHILAEHQREDSLIHRARPQRLNNGQELQVELDMQDCHSNCDSTRLRETKAQRAKAVDARLRSACESTRWARKSSWSRRLRRRALASCYG